MKPGGATAEVTEAAVPVAVAAADAAATVANVDPQETGCAGSETTHQQDEEAAAHTAGGKEASEILAPMSPPLGGVNLGHFRFCSTANHLFFYGTAERQNDCLPNQVLYWKGGRAMASTMLSPH